jgi:hypothetical protein
MPYDTRAPAHPGEGTRATVNGRCVHLIQITPTPDGGAVFAPNCGVSTNGTWSLVTERCDWQCRVCFGREKAKRR